MSCRVWSARSPDRPVQPGGDREADTGHRRIDNKILQSRVPSWRPELQDFEEADSGDGHHRREQSMPGVGCAERQADQNERERMLAVLTEVGVRPEPGRTQGSECNGSGQKPGEYSQDDDHEDGISRFIDRISPLPNWRCSRCMTPVRGHNASRTPRPNIKRSLICTGSRRVAPTPGLSSIRTAISVGAVADRD
jgi:hypothetical protein